MKLMSYCRMCGGFARPHQVIPTDYVSGSATLQCLDCGAEKEVRVSTLETQKEVALVGR